VVDLRARVWTRDQYGPLRRRIVMDIYFVSLFWILGFVFAIASAPCDLLDLNNQYMI